MGKTVWEFRLHYHLVILNFVENLHLPISCLQISVLSQMTTQKESKEIVFGQRLLEG